MSRMRAAGSEALQGLMNIIKNELSGYVPRSEMSQYVKDADLKEIAEGTIADMFKDSGLPANGTMAEGSTSTANELIGSVTAYAGTVAPDGYLICDGSEHQISEYPELVTHFEEQFGSKNHFGGDGVTTFAVPNYTSSNLPIGFIYIVKACGSTTNSATQGGTNHGDAGESGSSGSDDGSQPPSSTEEESSSDQMNESGGEEAVADEGSEDVAEVESIGQTITFSELPEPNQDILNYEYTITDGFTTNDWFVDGPGIVMAPGTTFIVMSASTGYKYCIIEEATGDETVDTEGLVDAMMVDAEISYSELQAPTLNNLHYLYAITDTFTTNNWFDEGAGINVEAGTIIKCIDAQTEYKYHIIGKEEYVIADRAELEDSESTGPEENTDDTSGIQSEESGTQTVQVNPATCDHNWQASKTDQVELRRETVREWAHADNLTLIDHCAGCTINETQWKIDHEDEYSSDDDAQNALYINNYEDMLYPCDHSEHTNSGTTSLTFKTVSNKIYAVELPTEYRCSNCNMTKVGDANTTKLLAELVDPSIWVPHTKDVVITPAYDEYPVTTRDHEDFDFNEVPTGTQYGPIHHDAYVNKELDYFENVKTGERINVTMTGCRHTNWVKHYNDSGEFDGYQCSNCGARMHTLWADDWDDLTTAVSGN